MNIVDVIVAETIVIDANDHYVQRLSKQEIEEVCDLVAIVKNNVRPEWVEWVHADSRTVMDIEELKPLTNRILFLLNKGARLNGDFPHEVEG